MTAPTSIIRALRERILSEVRDADVATVAGVAAATWGATDFPRVFWGDAGFRGHRNIGRLPFVEIWLDGQSFDDETSDSGTYSAQVALRCWVGNRGVDDASLLASDILSAALYRIRIDATDNYLVQGETGSMGPLTAGPWGHFRDLTITIELSYCRDNYGIWIPSFLTAGQWWDPTDDDQFTLTGSDIDVWTAKTQGTADTLVDNGVKPVRTASALNSRTAVVFPGSTSQRLVHSSKFMPATGAFFMAVRIDDLSNDPVLMGDNSPSTLFRVMSDGTVRYFGGANVDSAAGAVTAGQTAVLGVVNTDGSGTVAIRVDGAQVASGNSFGLFPSLDTLGENESGGNSADATFGDIITTTDTDTATLERIERFLAIRWGVAI